jgi:hypothetical protein
MTITYTEITNSLGQTIILRDNGDGTMSTIPADQANSDYQLYLNPETEDLTKIVPGDE